MPGSMRGGMQRDDHRPPGDVQDRDLRTPDDHRLAAGSQDGPSFVVPNPDAVEAPVKVDARPVPRPDPRRTRGRPERGPGQKRTEAESPEHPFRLLFRGWNEQ